MESNYHSSRSSTVAPSSPLRCTQWLNCNSNQQPVAPAPLRVVKKEEKEMKKNKGSSDPDHHRHGVHPPSSTPSVSLLSPSTCREDDEEEDEKEEEMMVSAGSTMPQTWLEVKKEINQSAGEMKVNGVQRGPGHETTKTRRERKMKKTILTAQEHMREFEELAGHVMEGFARLALKEKQMERARRS